MFVQNSHTMLSYRLLSVSIIVSHFLYAQSYDVYIGTFSQRESKGIYVFDFKDGQLTEKQNISTQESPSFLALHPNQKYLYAANRSSVDSLNPQHGSISAFNIDSISGKLTLINELSSKGGGACHLALSPDGKILAVSNYVSGSIAWYAVNPNGSIGKLVTHIQHKGKSINKDRQEGPHAHSAIPSRDGQYWFVSDLGMDAIITYRFEDGKFKEKACFKSEPGSGPRHFTLSPDEKYAYSIEELSSTVQVLKVKKSGKLKGIQRLSTIRDSRMTGSYCADIHWHPSGQFLAGSNRGPNTISTFKRLPRGKLYFYKEQISGGDWPRNFGFSPDGKYLIVGNERSDELVIYQVDINSTNFEEINRVKIPAPACVIWRKTQP